jgi:hypothetical protein
MFCVQELPDFTDAFLLLLLSHHIERIDMYHASGVDAIATITEPRSKTSEPIDYVQEHRQGVLIQKDSEPCAVLLDWKTTRVALPL